MANELYRTYEVLVEESVHTDHPKRATDKTKKPSVFNAEIDGALRDTHMIFQDAVCYNTLLFAGLAGNTELPDGDGKLQPLNPLWKHLTTPAKQGGINDETERVIRRLATHFKPLAGITTADEFLNRVYSEPLKIKPEMTAAERDAVMQMRAQCYRILEMFGAPQKETGGQECADMSAFANTWAGLTSKPESDTEIPGNLAYDRVCRELKQTLKDELSAKEAADILEKTILSYSAKAEQRNKLDCKQDYDEKLQELRDAVASANLLPDLDGEKAAKMKKTESDLKKHEESATNLEADFFKNRRDGLREAIVSALEKPLAAEKAADLGVSGAEFSLVKAYLETLHAFLASSHDIEAASDKIASATKLKDSNAKRAEKLKKASDELEKVQSARAASLAKLDESERSRAERLAARLARKSEMKAHGFIRLHYKGGNPGLFEKAMFRYWLLRNDENEAVRRVVLADFRKFIKDDKPDKEPRLDGKHIAAMPFTFKGAKMAFPLFGKQCLGIETIHSSPDWAFDKTAYATAAEDVFKYKIRTDVRKVKVRKLLNVVEAYENKGATLAGDDSPTGKSLTVHGMDGDPRWNCEDEKRKGIVQLLAGMSTEKKIGSYGLRAGTIGGWAEVRKALLAIHRKAQNSDGKVSDEAQLAINLEKAVDAEMEANRQGFGSADFFHELCDPAYFHLWLNSSGEIKDFIPHYVSYCEWREELIGLLTKDGIELERETELPSAELKKLAKKPIRYTWPGLLNRHKKPSYRYYDFTEKLNIALELKSLFRRVRPTDAPRGFPTYKKLNGESSKLTLAARRLKRDKIINKETGNSVDALWCPPLILAGEPNPTKENHPRAGKYEDAKKKVWTNGDAEVSFSLIARPLPGDYWDEVAGVPSASEKHPVHLTVSFKIEANALALLQKEGAHFIGGSLKGVDEEDEKRRFFRWPVDIESDKVAAQEAAEKAKKEAQKTGTTPKEKGRKVDVKVDELWCHCQNGFLVKESRYSKADKTRRVADFQILSIDLGNRFAAGFARLRIHADPNGEGRVISADGFLPVIKADMVRQGTLRLQGENAKIWQHVRGNGGVCKKDAGGNYLYALEDEEYGNQGRGRFPTNDEYTIFSKLAARVVPVESLSLSGKEKETYPELGDHLGFRLKRKIGRLRTLLNLVWRLCGENERNQRTGKHDESRDEAAKLFHKRMTVETLARSRFPKRPRQPGEAEEPGDVSMRVALASDEHWQKLKDDGLLDSIKGAAEKKRRQDLENALKQPSVWNWEKLAEAVKGQINDNFNGEDSLDRLLIAVIEFCLPLRGRHWGWERSRKARLHWDEKDDKHTPNIMGMRGLSMRRLDQILNLRQRCQSFAKLEDRYHQQFKAGNYNPPDSIARELIEDVCPLLLERSNRIREQRVDQAAHLILAEALGMELKSPEEVKDKKARKAEVDLHGEYKRRKDKQGKEYPRCSVIVLENLERYKTSQERTRSENSRLMQWAHRAIIEKLEDMCRPFGITLMLVDPAFSSHFDSRTGLPGVRVNEVPRDFEMKYPYAKWVNDKTKSGGETKLAEDIKKLTAQFEAHKDYNGKLVLAVEGGTDFVPVLAPLGGKDTFNADIGAAGNIGLRAIADPQRWDIFPRLRTKKVSETELRVTNWRGWFGKLPAEERLMRAADVVETAAGSTQPSQPAENRKRGKKKSAANADGKNAGDNAGLESGQSSEYPPYFVQHPQYEWLAENDLTKETFVFNQNGLKLRAYHQGAYLKKVEEKCALRITEINRARIEKLERGDDNIPM